MLLGVRLQRIFQSSVQRRHVDDRRPHLYIHFRIGWEFTRRLGCLILDQVDLRWILDEVNCPSVFLQLRKRRMQVYARLVCG